MHTATARARHAHTAIRPVMALLLTVLFLLSAAPARAAGQPAGPAELAQPLPEQVAPPTGPDDLTPPKPEATPQPTPEAPPAGPDDLTLPPPEPPSLELQPACDPAGFTYDVAGDVPPGNVVTVAWREAPDGPIHDLGATTSGAVLSGEGSFDVRATMTSGGEVVHTIDWTSIDVECETRRPQVIIDAFGVCAPHVGIHYEIDLLNPPDGDYVYEVQWRAQGGAFHTVEGQSGFIATGEGHFEVRGVVHHDEYGSWRSEIVEVTVDCHREPPVDPPIIVPPNFTG
jgi:hypothetical protein